MEYSLKQPSFLHDSDALIGGMSDVGQRVVGLKLGGSAYQCGLITEEHVENVCFPPPQFCRHWCPGFTGENSTFPLNIQPWLSQCYAGLLAQTCSQKARNRVTIL